MTCSNLAMLLQTMGKLDEAEVLMKDTLRRCRENLGDAHLYTLTSINNFAGLMRQKGILDEAERLLQEALDGLRLQLGSKHLDTLKTANNLATLLHDCHRYDEAEKLYNEVLAGRRQALGDWHAESMAIAKRLAVLQRARARWAEKAEQRRNVENVCNQVMPCVVCSGCDQHHEMFDLTVKDICFDNDVLAVPVITPRNCKTTSSLTAIDAYGKKASGLLRL
jgi:tetratricopeptide (TPR) repeat protein